MNDPTMRCPGCRGFDWYRDGFSMHELPDGFVVRERVGSTTAVEAPWSCSGCGYEVRDDDALGHRLSVAQMAHED